MSYLKSSFNDSLPMEFDAAGATLIVSFVGFFLLGIPGSGFLGGLTGAALAAVGHVKATRLANAVLIVTTYPNHDDVELAELAGVDIDYIRLAREKLGV